MDVDFSTGSKEQIAELKNRFVELFNMKQTCKGLSDDLSDFKAKIVEEEAELYEILSDVGLTSIKTSDLTFFQKKDRYISVKDRESCFKWLKENGYEDVIKPTVNSKTFTSVIKELESIVKEYEDDGKSIKVIDPDIINEKIVYRIGVRKKT